MKVLVVGASGRVGEELVKNLVADGRQVIAGTRHTDQDFGESVDKEYWLLADEATLVGELRPLNGMPFTSWPDRLVRTCCKSMLSVP